MIKKQKDIITLFIDSLTEHAAAKHLPELRNEDSKGRQLSPSRSKGSPLSAFDKEDFRQHLRHTLSNPMTRYFIDESDGRIVFFNANPENRSMITLKPAPNKDGHFGTIFRSRIKVGMGDFKDALEYAEKNMGRPPEIRSVVDGGHIGHFQK